MEETAASKRLVFYFIFYHYFYPPVLNTEVTKGGLDKVCSWVWLNQMNNQHVFNNMVTILRTAPFNPPADNPQYRRGTSLNSQPRPA